MNMQTFFDRVVALREAQKAYMEARAGGAPMREELGQKVAEAATLVDAAIAHLNVDRVRKVYAAIDTERAYQDRMAADPSRPDMIKDLGPGATLLAMSENMNRARAAWYVGSDTHPEAMGFVRKVCALGVQLGEQLGMPTR